VFIDGTVEASLLRAFFLADLIFGGLVEQDGKSSGIIYSLRVFSIQKGFYVDIQSEIFHQALALGYIGLGITKMKSLSSFPK
jgi:hypothetical protein